MRWEKGATERLQKAALELFARRGFEQTTAAEIARAAGLTQRTFFRHFADKRDVLFHGQDAYVAAFLAGVDGAPDGEPPLTLVGRALASAAELFPDERRDHARMRQAVIVANAALQERERHKSAGVAAHLGAALRARGVPEPAATLASESGVTVFTLAFAQWLVEDERRSLAEIAADTLAELRALGAPR